MFIRVLFLLIATYPLLCQGAPLSILIIGGGPAGLATAIEAKAANADVIIVEKRESYTREGFVFLLKSTLDLLNRWEVTIPGLKVFEIAEDKIGVTNIRNLEMALEERVHALGVPKILGEFQDFEKDRKVVVTQENGNIDLSYDLLIGADGMHSTVRHRLNIASTVLASAVGSIVLIPLPIESPKLDFILPFKCDTLFINKIWLPSNILINVQGEQLSKEILSSAFKKLGWEEDSMAIFTDSVKYVDNIEIVLQQSLEFSDLKKSAILIGDAAASASFLQGKGANSALESATIAGRFFKTEQTKSDFANFNQAMQELTDHLIEDSAFLFK